MRELTFVSGGFHLGCHFGFDLGFDLGCHLTFHLGFTVQTGAACQAARSMPGDAAVIISDLLLRLKEMRREITSGDGENTHDNNNSTTSQHSNKNNPKTTTAVLLTMTPEGPRSLALIRWDRPAPPVLEGTPVENTGSVHALHVIIEGVVTVATLTPRVSLGRPASDMHGLHVIIASPRLQRQIPATSREKRNMYVPYMGHIWDVNATSEPYMDQT